MDLKQRYSISITQEGKNCYFSRLQYNHVFIFIIIIVHKLLLRAVYLLSLRVNIAPRTTFKRPAHGNGVYPVDQSVKEREDEKTLLIKLRGCIFPSVYSPTKHTPTRVQ